MQADMTGAVTPNHGNVTSHAGQVSQTGDCMCVHGVIKNTEMWKVTKYIPRGWTYTHHSQADTSKPGNVTQVLGNVTLKVLEMHPWAEWSLTAPQ